MYNGFGSSTTVANTTISGNTQDQCCASLGGGGIPNLERLTVISSIISGNRAGDGGGIVNNRGTTEIVASTISGNAA